MGRSLYLRVSTAPEPPAPTSNATRTSPPAPCLSAPAPTALPEPSASMAAPAAVEPASPHPPLGECSVHQPHPARASTCLMGSGWTSMSRQREGHHAEPQRP